MCHQAGRPDYRSHFLSTCKYLPDSGRQFLSRVRQISGLNAPEDYADYPYDDDRDIYVTQDATAYDEPPKVPAITRRVNVKQSPYLHAFFNHHPLRLTIDTGAETNMMRVSLAKYIGAKITKSSQLALQADGLIPCPSQERLAYL